MDPAIIASARTRSRNLSSSAPSSPAREANNSYSTTWSLPEPRGCHGRRSAPSSAPQPKPLSSATETSSKPPDRRAILTGSYAPVRLARTCTVSRGVGRCVRLPETREHAVDGALQRALDRLGIDVQLDASIEAVSHSGYWPARLDGRPSGFEILVGPIPEVFGRTAPPGVDERDIAADFVTHSDIRELQCSMLAAAVFGIETDGLIFDDDTEGLMQPTELLEQARAIDLS